ncbi:Succinate-semialdehyde dehydrogenase, mitochondrial-like protein [Drosera capensis]
MLGHWFKKKAECDYVPHLVEGQTLSIRKPIDLPMMSTVEVVADFGHGLEIPLTFLFCRGSWSNHSMELSIGDDYKEGCSSSCKWLHNRYLAIGGVVNVVMGNAAEIGEALMTSKEDYLHRVYAVGKKLMADAAGTVKKVYLELGGNAPCIVFNDADLDVAVKGTELGVLSLQSAFPSCQSFLQIMLCIPLAHAPCVLIFDQWNFCFLQLAAKFRIYEKFANAFAKAVQSLQVGDGFSEGVAQGPLINDAALHKVESFVQDAISKGEKVLLGGKRHKLGTTFYEPTIITDVKGGSFWASCTHSAIQNRAGCNPASESRQCRIFIPISEKQKLYLSHAGLVSTEVAPFGGFKQSGLGREGSKYGMDEYLENNGPFVRSSSTYSLPCDGRNALHMI